MFWKDIKDPWVSPDLSLGTTVFCIQATALALFTQSWE